MLTKLINETVWVIRHNNGHLWMGRSNNMVSSLNAAQLFYTREAALACLQPASDYPQWNVVSVGLTVGITDNLRVVVMLDAHKRADTALETEGEGK